MKKNRLIAVIAVFLIISIGTYFRIVSDGTIRMVEFLSILAIGMLTGMLLSQILKLIKESKDA